MGSDDLACVVQFEFHILSDRLGMFGANLDDFQILQSWQMADTKMVFGTQSLFKQLVELADGRFQGMRSFPQ